MHMQGVPASMQELPQYENIVDDVVDFFQRRLAACELAGVARENIILDPGFGFGKSMRHNALLLQHLENFQTFALPLLAGLSRKSMIDQLLQGRAVNDRMAASIVLAAMAVERGAWIVRVHDVKASYDAINIVAAIRRETEKK
jgi:dihydropteroate synthase